MKKYTFMIIPHKSGRRPMEFNVSRWVLGLGAFFVLGLFVVFGSTLYLSSKVANITVKYYQLEDRNKKVLSKLEGFNEKTENLKTIILSLKEKDQEIRKLLGLKPNNKYYPVSLKKK